MNRSQYNPTFKLQYREVSEEISTYVPCLFRDNEYFVLEQWWEYERDPSVGFWAEIDVCHE